MLGKRLFESWFSQGSKRFRNFRDFTVVSALYTWERIVSYLTPLQTALPNATPSSEVFTRTQSTFENSKQGKIPK